ncbi:RHS repeat-associated core domain-containing protein, partial [Pseudomonas sp. H11T01]|uniref:RHS repeat-associated core domain-containing protein n=1 Tax=Pseudomonas sp. H11T01 TaxID=3402749 RepID=UPI003AC5BFD9
GALQYSIVQHGDQLLAQQQRQGDALDATLLATDQQRSVLHTVNANTPKAIAYSPYGHRPAESGLTSLLGFNGERPDSVTGHYLLGNGYRAFNPVLMRFNSPDRLSPFGKGGLNSYAYCLGDPINWTDQTGQAVSPFTLLSMVSKWASRVKRKVPPRIILSQNTNGTLMIDGAPRKNLSIPVMEVKPMQPPTTSSPVAPSINVTPPNRPSLEYALDNNERLRPPYNDSTMRHIAMAARPIDMMNIRTVYPVYVVPSRAASSSSLISTVPVSPNGVLSETYSPDTSLGLIATAFNMMPVFSRRVTSLRTPSP